MLYGYRETRLLQSYKLGNQNRGYVVELDYPCRFTVA